MAKVLRILSVAALLVVVVAGCGDAAPQRSTAGGVPRALAREGEAQASAIADAARARQDCEALRLPGSPPPEGTPHAEGVAPQPAAAPRPAWQGPYRPPP